MPLPPLPLHLAALGAAILAAAAAPASAQQGAAVRGTIGAGADLTPDYFGAEDYSFSPAGTARIDYLRLPNGFEIGSQNAIGFLRGFGPRFSFDYIGSRKRSDNPQLRGLEDVDAALEVGLGLGYEAEYWRAFGDVRYGAIGHHSWTGEIGADAILKPNDAWVVNFGPRASWGSGRFMDTYFGVTPAEEQESTFDSYDPPGGFYGVGVELGARYAFSESWGVEGKAVYERLIDDAADSPIVETGSPNQLGLQVLITRSITLGF